MNPNILTMPLIETFACDGKAPNVLGAHNLAHDALEAALGIDPPAAWTLKVMQHSYDVTSGGVVFHAEFARNPEFESDES
jgi:hypothetical protein